MKYSAKDIEDMIYKYLPEEQGYQKDVIQAMNYAFKAGGKRIRPMMMRLTYDMLTEPSIRDDEAVCPFMAAIEMIHTYSLIHDDLPALDNDDFRRGRPTVHRQFGEDIAILAGDGLLNYGFETAARAFLSSCDISRVSKAFTVLTQKPGIYGMIGGQTLDVIKSGQKIDDSELHFIYTNKTAALIECSVMIGGILAGADDSTVAVLEQIANCVGMAFQVQDDILDIVGDEKLLGKPVQSDERNNKYTYATLYGIDAARRYVEETSKKAMDLLSGISFNDKEAGESFRTLIVSLIDREK